MMLLISNLMKGKIIRQESVPSVGLSIPNILLHFTVIEIYIATSIQVFII